MGWLRVTHLMLWVVFLLPAQQASAGRHLIAIAAHRGGVAETPLRFAYRDAQRIQRVFIDVGETKAGDSMLLIDPSLADVRSAFAAISDGRVKPEDTLVIYVSAHMDDESIHLGPERFLFKELFQSGSASGAALRVFILDGCRSGSVTIKGVQRVGPAKILRPRPNPSQGEVVLTSSSPGEDALESDRLAGSFFTHFLVNGLRGAADNNRDGQVSIEEVLSFSHDRTVYATAGSPSGSQHPAFKLDLAGSGTYILSRPGSSTSQGARLRIAKTRDGIVYLLNRYNDHLVAEVSLDRPGVLVVPAGAYRVRVATASRVLEGQVVLHQAATVELDSIDLEEVPLLALLRKGEGQASRRWAVRLEAEGGVGDPYGYGGLAGLRATGTLEWRSISLFLEMLYHYVDVEANFTDDSGLAGARRDLKHAFGLGVGLTHPLSLGSVNLVFGLGLEGRMYTGIQEPDQPEIKPWGIYDFAVGLVPVVRLEVPVGSRLTFSFSMRETVLLLTSGSSVHTTWSTALGLGWVF